jgi:multidrug transporter EmrE-like cation transporter
MKKAALFSMWIGLPALSTLFQASAKLLAAQLHGTPLSFEWLGRAIHSPWAFAVLSSEALSFFLWLNVLTSVPLSKAFPITAVAYISILLTSWTVFDETVQPLQIFGSALILTGVWLIGTVSSENSPKGIKPSTT